MDANLF